MNSVPLICPNYCIQNGRFYSTAMSDKGLPDRGINQHGSLFGKIFSCKVISYKPEGEDGPTIYLNRKSLSKWLFSHGVQDVANDKKAEIEALEARRAKTRDLKQAMMQELLTGRIRLV